MSLVHRQLSMYQKLTLSLLLLSLLPIALTMFAQTSLLDCWVSPSQVTDPVKRDHLKSNLTTLLAKHLAGLKLLSELDVDGSLLLVYSGPRSSTITVRAHKEGLVTVNLDYRMNNGERSLLGYAVSYFSLNLLFFFYFFIVLKSGLSALCGLVESSWITLRDVFKREKYKYFYRCILLRQVKVKFYFEN